MTTTGPIPLCADVPVLDTLRLVGSGGSNRAMEAELKRLARRGIDGWRDKKPKRLDEQTLIYPYSADLAYLATNYLRTPSRVLQDLYEVKARRLEPLYEEVASWIATESRSWLKDGRTISVRAKDVRDFPASASQIQGTIKNAIIDGSRPRDIKIRLDPHNPDFEISVRGTGGTLVLSLDLAGRSLHERGYRLDRVAAPLRENLAAQILMLARWDVRREVLVDPMCGSGTFAIEGASMAQAAPLWISPNRPSLDALDEFRDRTRPPLFADAQPTIVVNDQHGPSLKATRTNSRRAGVDGHIMVTHGDFRELTKARIEGEPRPAKWPKPDLSRGLIVCNPPYGERLDDPAELYADLRDWALDYGDGWRAAFLVADPKFDYMFEQQPRLKKPLANGPIKTTLFVFDLR